MKFRLGLRRYDIKKAGVEPAFFMLFTSALIFRL